MVGANLLVVTVLPLPLAMLKRTLCMQVLFDAVQPLFMVVGAVLLGAIALLEP